MRLNIMDPEDRRAIGDADKAGGERAGETLGGNVLAGQPANRRFARDAEQDRAAEDDQFAEASDQLEILHRRFAETEAGVEDQLFTRNAGGKREIDRERQKTKPISDDIDARIN